MKKTEVKSFLFRKGWSDKQVDELNIERKKLGYPSMWEEK